MTFAATQSERTVPLRDAVHAALRRSGYRPLVNLECEACDGRITLRGVVPSFYLKQVAQAVAMRVDCVREVCNGVQVDSHGPSPGGSHRDVRPPHRSGGCRAPADPGR